MDEQLDHGPIIHRERLNIESHETSADVYRRLLDREIELVNEWMPRLINGDYITTLPETDGNVHTRNSFQELKELRLEQMYSAESWLRFLRAMTFDGYQNAYYVDPVSGKRCFVRIQIEVEG
jgi:methionyl-tRNA formyltransferase